MPEEIASNLVGKRISRTFRGLVHFPHSIDTNTYEKQLVYDGQGTPTSLTLGGSGKGAEITGDVTITKSLSVTNNLTLTGDFTVGGNISMIGGGSINEVEIYNTGSLVTMRSINELQAGKVRIREMAGQNFELIYGDPRRVDSSRNLFTLKVNNDVNKNFYIKNNYEALDIYSPLWIERSTGDVYIKTLKTTKITTVDPPNKPNKPPITWPRTPDHHRNEIPIGMISIFPVSAYSGSTVPGGSSVPDGWLECDGMEYSRSLFPELFDIIKWNYSPISIRNTDRFRVPDLRGLFVRAWDHQRIGETGYVARDMTPNRDVGSYQGDTFKSHLHDLDQVSTREKNVYGGFTLGATFALTGPCGPVVGALLGGVIGMDVDRGVKAGSGGKTMHVPPQGDPSGLETRPKNMIMVYAIKW
jgi:hypothetical protein